MKTKITLLGLILLSCGGLWAQVFSPPGIYSYTNDNLGIGPVFNNANPPTQTLDVDGKLRIRSLDIDSMNQNNNLNRILVADNNGTLFWRDAPSISQNNFSSFPDSAGDSGSNTNSFFGHQSGSDAGANNTFIGFRGGMNNTGIQNTFIGSNSGNSANNTSGSGNVFIGYNTGSIAPANTSNRLYIDNSSTEAPLIWGDFDGNLLRFNGNVEIGSGETPAGLNVTGRASFNSDMEIGDQSGDDLIVNSTATFANPANFDAAATFNGITDFNADATFDNVGIGTDTPTVPLHVAGQSRFEQNADFNSNLTVDANLGIGTDTPTVPLHVAGQSRFEQNADFNSNLTVDANLGIGTDTPTVPLHVNGASIFEDTSTFNGAADFDDNMTIGSNVSNNLTVYSTATFINPVDFDDDIILGNQATDVLTINSTTTFNGVTDFNANATFDNVGIGTDTPTAPLHVNGAVRLENLTEDNTNTYTQVLVSDAGGNVRWRGEPALDDQNIDVTENGNDRTINISGGTGDTFSVDDGDSDPNNELQNLSVVNAGNNRTINISGGSGTVFSVDDGDSNPVNELQSWSTLPGIPAGFTDGVDNQLSEAQVDAYANNNGYLTSANINPNFPSFPQSAGDGGGNDNAFFGHQAGASNIGNDNTFIGYQSGFSNTTGFGNTANGHQALYSNTTGSANIAIGRNALDNNTTANGNTAIGYGSLPDNTTGSQNTAVGISSLYFNITGAYNTAIGNSAGPNNGNFDNTTALGFYATPTASNQVRIGNDDVTSIGGYAAWSNLSDGRFKKNVQEDIPGLEFIKEIRPVSYEIDKPKLRTFLGKAQPEAAKNTNTKTQRRSIGFVAQEVEEVLQAKGYTPIGVESPQNEGDHYSIRYAEFVVPLVKAVQEQQEMIQEQQTLIENMQQEIALLKNQNPATANPFGTETQAKNTGGFALYQNVPNPFNTTTTIEALVPEQIQQAKIIVYNLQGLELESYDINQRGNAAVEISAGHFPSGMYLYALIADDRVIDTKKMILTK